MISLCSVILDNMEETWGILLDSILRKTKLISEVILVKVDEEYNGEEVWVERGIKFRKFGYLLTGERLHGHALGLHKGIDVVQNEYIMFCDPDIFFYTSVEELYFELMNNYGIDIVGVSHHAATDQAFLYFPCVMNMMVKKSNLPDGNFLKGDIRLRTTVLRNPKGEPDDIDLLEVEHKYLTVGPIPKYIDYFPNKNFKCRFDVGCNLYLWAQQQNMKWLSFQTLDCHIYTTTYYRTNVKQIKIPIPRKQKLLYHMTTGTLSGLNCDLIKDQYKSALEMEKE